MRKFLIKSLFNLNFLEYIGWKIFRFVIIIVDLIVLQWAILALIVVCFARFLVSFMFMLARYLGYADIHTIYTLHYINFMIRYVTYKGYILTERFVFKKYIAIIVYLLIKPQQCIYVYNKYVLKIWYFDNLLLSFAKLITKNNADAKLAKQACWCLIIGFILVIALFLLVAVPLHLNDNIFTPIKCVNYIYKLSLDIPAIPVKHVPVWVPRFSVYWLYTKYTLFTKGFDYLKPGYPIGWYQSTW